jgi:glycerol-3-phosphate acyltransferase PlsY
LFAAIAGLYVVVRHRANIARLRAGTEPRIGEKATETVSEPVSEPIADSPPEPLGS